MWCDLGFVPNSRLRRTSALHCPARPDHPGIRWKMALDQIPLVNSKAHFLDQLHWTDQFRNDKESNIAGSQYRRQYDLLFESRRRTRWTPTFLWGSEACGGAGNHDNGEVGLSWIPNRDGQVLLAELESGALDQSAATPLVLPRLDISKVQTKNQTGNQISGKNYDLSGTKIETAIQPALEILTKGPSGQMLPPYMIERERAR